MLDRTIDEIDAPIVVVGPTQSTHRNVQWVREDPEFAGPVAAIAAAMALVQTEHVGLIAADMPNAAPLLNSLAADVGPEESVVCVDADGRRQPLCSMLSRTHVAAALELLGTVEHRSMQELFSVLDVHEHRLCEAESALLRDIDTPEDLQDFGG